MTVERRKIVLALTLMSSWLAAGQRAEAVAFKVHNQTDLEFRMRVHDRGAWREWVTMRPQYWDCPAGGVKRTTHAVEIDVHDGTAWVPFYRGTHGSKTFTRVLLLFKDGGGDVVMAWFDEPPGVRSKPVWDGTKVNHGLLIKSGWLPALIGKAARTAIQVGGKTLYRKVLGGN